MVYRISSCNNYLKTQKTIKILISMAVTIAQLVKCLLHKYEDPSSKLEAKFKTFDVVEHIYNASTGEAKMGRALGFTGQSG